VISVTAAGPAEWGIYSPSVFLIGAGDSHHRGMAHEGAQLDQRSSSGCGLVPLLWLPSVQAVTGVTLAPVFCARLLWQAFVTQNH